MHSPRSTSLAAHRAGKVGGKAATLRAKVFLHLLLAGEEGATIDEMERALELPGNTVRPRRVELEERGWVVDSTRRRPTQTGKLAIVWVVPEAVAESARAVLRAQGKIA